MRLNEYIQKSLFPDIVPDTDPFKKSDDWYFAIAGDNFALKADILNKINKECSQIINEYKKAGRLLFRGSNSKGPEVSPNVYRCVPRTDRRPKDTNWTHHIEVNELFKEKFGWYVRSEGVFASTKTYSAASYGDLNLFLPINGYEYVWSRKYNDLYSDFLENLEDFLYDETSTNGYWLHPITKQKFTDTNQFKQIKGYITYKFEDYDTRDVLILYKDNKTNIKQEISMKFITEIDKDELRINEMKKVIKTYKSTDLFSAFKGNTGREIVFKCKYFYLIGLHGNQTHKYDNLKIEDFGLGL